MLLKKLSIDKLGSKLKNQRVLIRVDFNVPMAGNKISDTTRIKESIPTIKYALENGAKSITLLSHFGRPNGAVNQKYSLSPVAPVLAELMNKDIHFLNNCVGSEVEKVI